MRSKLSIYDEDAENKFEMEMVIGTATRLVSNALTIAADYGQYDGGHHKMWVIDQMVKALTEEHYDQFIEWYEDEDYKWDTGIAP